MCVFSELQLELENVHFGVQQAHQKTFGTHDIIDVVGCVWMVKINQASHLIGASTFLCVISRRCHLHAAPARVDGTIFLTGQIWYYLNGFRIFVQMIHRIISRSGVAKVRRAWEGPPVPILSLLYTFWQERHDINDVKFQSVCLKIAGKLERCSCFQKSGPMDPVAFGWVTIQ